LDNVTNGEIIKCSNEKFGDPAPGHHKSCYKKKIDYEWCANEDHDCAFDGETKDIIYKRSDGQEPEKYRILPFQKNSVECNNKIFGDPVPGEHKACYKINRTLTHCANEDRDCASDGQKNDIIYKRSDGKDSINNKYLKNIDTTKKCNNETFGDPAPGHEKGCFIDSNPNVESSDQFFDKMNNYGVENIVSVDNCLYSFMFLGGTRDICDPNIDNDLGKCWNKFFENWPKEYPFLIISHCNNRENAEKEWDFWRQKIYTQNKNIFKNKVIICGMQSENVSRDMHSDTNILKDRYVNDSNGNYTGEYHTKTGWGFNSLADALVLMTLATYTNDLCRYLEIVIMLYLRIIIKIFLMMKT